MKQHLAEDLIDKYHKGLCTADEKNLVEAGFNRLLSENTAQYAVSEIEAANLRMQEKITAHLNAHPAARKTAKLWARFSAAASILLIVTALLFYVKEDSKTLQQPAHSQLKANDVAPGRNTATLTLSDGRKVILSDANNGQLAEQAGVKIRKTGDGQLVYDTRNSNSDARNTENTLSTAKGETYRVVLPDGSRVWLNAASSLTFPASFITLKQRKVTLSGEAYFEVSKDKNRPFIVSTADQQVVVLGTHFNISSYADEAYAKTTLLEGAIRVSSGKGNITLRPGQQSTLYKQQGDLRIAEVDTEEVMAWKNGYFMFVNEDINTVMKKISRWYDVEVIYEQNVSGKALWGTISRFKNVSQVLNMLELTGVVKFKIEGRRIIVKTT